MQQDDVQAFQEVMQGVHDFYGKDCSPFALDVWWQALRPYDLEAIRDALGRHCVNPDNGQWMPKPADVVRLIEGSTVDSALVAWTKVERGMQAVGSYCTVVFDDPLIHAVIADMGGWPALGGKRVEEWPFVAKEFQTRYRGFKGARATPAYPPKLIGIADGNNVQRGYAEMNPVLLGDSEAARRVLAGGDTRPRLTVMNLQIPVADRASA